ncbi:MAG: rRNA processing protein RimM [Deltaproteobacteria bacterium]|jgi:16S rRNA processing protein RimM|nr:rRNA processing protein RimM [Deltaproteobacteria bacterium]
MVADRLVAVGKVVKAHGVRGHLRLVPFGETLEGLGAGEEVSARLPDGSIERLITVEIRTQRKSVLFLSREVRTAAEAQRLVGAEICVPESRLPALAADEFYWHQLIGLEVMSVDGRRLGTIRQIIETGSNDVYVVQEGREEVLIPALAEVVREVNLERRLMVVDLPALV